MLISHKYKVQNWACRYKGVHGLVIVIIKLYLNLTRVYRPREGINIRLINRHYLRSYSGQYCYIEDLLALNSYRPQDTCRSLPQSLHTVSMPLSSWVWDHKLAGHPDQPFRNYVVTGLRDGLNRLWLFPHMLQLMLLSTSVYYSLTATPMSI